MKYQPRREASVELVPEDGALALDPSWLLVSTAVLLLPPAPVQIRQLGLWSCTTATSTGRTGTRKHVIKKLTKSTLFCSLQKYNYIGVYCTSSNTTV